MKQPSLIDMPLTKEYATPTKIRIALPYPPSVNSANRSTTILPSAADMQAEFRRLFKKHKLIGDNLFKEYWHWFRGKVRSSIYKSQEVKDFRLLVWSACNRLHCRYKWEKNLKATMWIHPPDNRNRDSSNLWKETEDALEAAGVFKNDKQIKEHHDYWLNPVTDGLVVLELELL